MKKVKFLVFFMLLAFITTCTVFADTLAMGNEGQAVAKLQTQLKRMGYYNGNITGHFGSETKAAVKRFQLYKGMFATGVVDERLSKLLFGGTSSSANTGTAVSQAALKQAQTKLKQLGLYSGKIDGFSGPTLVNAVKNYQKKYGLKVTGKLDAVTLNSINTAKKQAAAVKPNTAGAKKPAAKASAAAFKIAAKTPVKTEITKMNTLAATTTLMPGDPGNVDMWQEQTVLQSNTGEANVEEDTSKDKDTKVEVLDWWKDARYVFKIGTVATVIDLQSGKSFKIVRTYGANHADCETLTKEDTAIMKEIYGGQWSWDRRPIVLDINGRLLAASMAGMPHAGLDELPANQTVTSRSGGFGRGANLDRIKDNDMSGHFDVHFLNSRTHGTDKVDPKHQAAIKEAAKAVIENGVVTSNE